MLWTMNECRMSEVYDIVLQCLQQFMKIITNSKWKDYNYYKGIGMPNKHFFRDIFENNLFFKSNI